MADRELKVKISIDVSGVKSGTAEAAKGVENVGKAAKQAGDDLDGAGKKADSSGGSMSNFGKVVGAAVVLGAGLATKSMLTLGMAFESSLNTLQAVSGASASTMGQVSEAAKALGNDLSLPGASASDAAFAMTELAKGGLSVEEAMSAAKGTLQLAAAAQIDGAQAAQIQSAALNTFGLEASEAGRVADVLANAANASSGEITDFAQGMAMSGLAANALGISVEDTATALGMFANKGLSGSDAGTSFKTMLLSLASPTTVQAGALEDLGVKAFDAAGNFVGMRTVTEQLAAASKNMTQEQFTAAAATAFGTDAVRAAVAMANEGVDGFDKMSIAIGHSGGAADLAAANSKGLKGAVDLVRNAAETASITLFDSLSPALDTATRGIADMIPALASELSPALSTVGLAFVDVIQAVLPLVPVLVSALAPALTSVAEAIAELAKDAAPLISILGTLFGDVLAGAMPVLTAIVGMISDVAGVFLSLPTPIVVAGAALLTVALARAPLAALWTQIVAVRTAAVTAAAGATGMAGGMNIAGAAATRLGVALKGAFLSNPIGLAIVGIVTAISLFAGGEEDAVDPVVALTNVVDDQTGAFTDNASAALSAAAAKDGTLAALTAQGIAEGVYTQALLGNEIAQGQVKSALEANIATQGVATAAGMEAVALLDAYNLRLADIAAKQAAGTQAGAENAAAQKQSNDIIAAAKIDQDAYVASLEATAARTGDVATATVGASPTVEEMATQIKGMGDEASASDTRLQFLQITLDALNGKAPGIEAASRAAQAAIRGYVETQLDQVAAAQEVDAATRKVEQAQMNLTAATEKGTDENYSAEQKALDVADAADSLADAQRGVTTATNNVTDASDELFSAGQQVYQGFLQQTQSAFDSAKGSMSLAAAQEVARAKGQELRDAFVAQQIAAGKSADEANRLADELGLIPSQVSTQVSLLGMTDAQRAVEAFKTSLDGIPSERRIRIMATYTGPASLAGKFEDSIVRAEGGMSVGGVQMMAEGGMIRPAMMASGGKGILWAEAGDESYVPHKRNARTEDIMSRTASILGGQYMSAAQLASFNKPANPVASGFVGAPATGVLGVGGGTSRLEAKFDQLIAAQKGTSITKLAEKLTINNTTSDGTAGFNDALFKLNVLR